MAATPSPPRSSRSPSASSKHGTIPLKFADLTYWSDKLDRFIVEKEPVELRGGDSSRNILLTTRIQIRLESSENRVRSIIQKKGPMQTACQRAFAIIGEAA